jgi:Fe-S cluster biogenesis protein NfuA
VLDAATDDEAAAADLTPPARPADAKPVARTDASTLRRRVELALDRLRPALLQDGGNLELLELAEDGTLHIELQGACVSCPAQAATLRYAIEPALRREVPEVIAVVMTAGNPEPAPVPPRPRS